jgi:hypothetical protein
MSFNKDNEQRRVNMLAKLGEKLVIGHLRQTFKRHFRVDLEFDYPDLGRQGKIMYSACTLSFQKSHMNAISDKAYVAEMVAREKGKDAHSPWSDAAGFYISHYADFAGLWSWVDDPHREGYKNLECHGWHGELIAPIVEYARSVGKLELQLKHSEDKLAEFGIKQTGKHSDARVLPINRS